MEVCRLLGITESVMLHPEAVDEKEASGITIFTKYLDREEQHPYCSSTKLSKLLQLPKLLKLTLCTSVNM